MSAALELKRLPADTAQVIVVTSDTPECITGSVALYTKADTRWSRTAGPFAAVLGRSGMGADKKEGDGTTPTGTYALGTGFGYAARAQTAMPYKQTAADDVWIDDVTAPDYNTWVKRGATHAKSFEQLHRDDGLYELGFVIEYNTHPVRAGAGSAIFMHVWRAPNKPTAGCVALEKSSVQAIAGKLDPSKHPQIIIGPLP